MKKILTVHLILRVVPFALFALLMLLDLSSRSMDGRVMRVCCYLIASAVIYVAYPLTRDESSQSVRFCAVCSLFFVCAGLLLGDVGTVEYLFLLPAGVFTMLYMVGCLVVKYKEPAAIFRKDAAWCCAEEDSRTFYGCILLSSVMVLMAFRNGYVQAAMAVFLLVLNIALHMKAYTGRTLLIGRKKERRIQTLLLSNGHLADVVPEVDNAILARAYRRIEQFIKDHKPYLDDQFTLEKMADILKLNKVYISRSINKFTGKNFRQFINWHRVLYSVELMRADPWLKVIELAFMSGFHSQVTFNMCFKLFMDETPSDMLCRLRLQKPRPELSRIEVKLPPDEVAPSSPDEEK